MIKKLLLINLLVLILFSCKKKEPDPEPICETEKWGTITISNSSSNPYYIYIDDVLKMTLEGGKISTEIKIDEGNSRKLYAKQVSGYLLFPTEKTENFNVLRCSNYSWQIP